MKQNIRSVMEDNKQQKLECEDCGSEEKETFPCERCNKIIFENCQTDYNPFTQIDYNCCQSCAETKH